MYDRVGASARKVHPHGKRSASHVRSLLLLCGLTLALFATSGSALADPTVRLIGGTSGVLVTDPSGHGLSNFELDQSIRADVRHVADRIDLRLDYLGREGFVNPGFWLRPDATVNSNEQLLRELSAKVALSRSVRLTVGRFGTPGDFWLIADGAKLEIDYAPWLTHSIYGGLRAFTSGYQEADLTSTPGQLKLAGTSLDIHTPRSDTQLLFTWAMDGLAFSNQLSQAGTLVQEHHVEDGYFIQATSSLRPTRGSLLLGGVRMGTRYDMQFNAVTPFGPTNIGTANLESRNVWALAEWAPEREDGRLRFQYQLNLQQVHVYQSELIGVGSNGQPISSADGDFQDHGLAVIGRFSRTTRASFGYRLRFRENGDREHHFAGGLRNPHLVGDFGYVGSLDYGVIDPATIFFGPTVKKFVRAVYAFDATYNNQRFDARLGIHYIDAIGSNMLSSQYPPPATGVLKTQLFPFSLDTDRVVVGSVFYSGDLVFCGVDIEESTVSWQLRALAQVGIAL
jgi:hypothetical protein